MSNLFGRQAQLIVTGANNGLDLSEMHFKFEIKQSDLQAPNTAYIRVFNLSDDTANKIRDEFTEITISAGYINNTNFGVIFSGTIMQLFKGRESATTSYLDIYAADGDDFYNWAVISESVAAGITPQQDINNTFKNSQIDGVNNGYQYADETNNQIAGSPTLANSRGKVKFGMARDYARDWCNKYGYRWSIQNGQIVVIQNTGYLPGEAVVLSQSTGLIGVPEATNDGVNVRCLMNPAIRIGCLVQIAKSDVNRLIKQQIGMSYNSIPVDTVTTKQGFYRVMVCEFSGDTRGQAWYNDLVCLAVDVTKPIDDSVSLTGVEPTGTVTITGWNG